jgi:DNA polymerase-3 subunit gamma/tau
MPNESPPQARREAGSYQVVARKYRPQLFDELVGQPHVAHGLSTAITTERVGHAYLFTGARGTGKTSTARIFAKALNCEQGPTPSPCNKCESCVSITGGGDVDVIEIDGASNRGIDDIRQLRANVAIRPSRSRFKIYIIDEVHMLTTESFNALLKTLEEPPEHVKFVFCTTNPEKLPITVLSRCQRFDFAPVATDAIQKRLSEIAKNEGLTAEPEALKLLARRAAGSMRDSQSLLEQLLSVCEQEITVEDVHRMLGTARGARLAELMEQLANRDAATALASIDTATREGVDVGQLAEQLLGYLRDMLTATVGGSPDLMLHSAADEYALLVENGRKLGAETLLAMLQIVDHALVRMKTSMHPRVLLEVAVVRICQLEALDELASVLASLRGGAVPAAGSHAGGPATRPNSPAPAAPGTARGPAAPGPATVQKKTEHITAEPLNEPAQPPRAASSEGILTPANATEIWQQVLDNMGDMVADMGRLAAQVASSGPNRLVASFPAEYITHKEFCERPNSRSRFEKALSDLTGEIIRVDFELLPGKARPTERPTPAPNKRLLMKELERHPLVQQTMEAFGAEVVNAEPPRPK